MSSIRIEEERAKSPLPELQPETPRPATDFRFNLKDLVQVGF